MQSSSASLAAAFLGPASGRAVTQTDDFSRDNAKSYERMTRNWRQNATFGAQLVQGGFPCYESF
jgi:hypothetical protein